MVVSIVLLVDAIVGTVNLVKLTTDTSIKGYSHFVATNVPLPIKRFTKLTVCGCHYAVIGTYDCGMHGYRYV